MAGPRPRALTLVAFGLVTATVLAAQIVLSRLLAGTLTYYYAFMVISLAMLGLASGGLLVQTAPRAFRAERVGVQAAAGSLGMGLAVPGGTLAMLWTYPHVSLDPVHRFFTQSHLLLGALFACLFPLFFFGGLVVALVLKHARAHFPLVYGIDLLTAAAGCLLAVGLLTWLTPVEALLSVLGLLPLVAAAGFAFADRRPRLGTAALALAAVALCLSRLAVTVPAIADPPHLRWLDRTARLSAWNAQSNVRVFPGGFLTWSLSATYGGPLIPMADLLIDGVGGSQIVLFDGNPASLARYDYLDKDLNALAQRLVPVGDRQLIIGPGGGVDILQGVRRGRREITAVEINPLIVRVVNEDLAAYSGRPYQLPGVRVVVDNGRTFVRRTPEQWGLISLTWVDHGGSATALAFAENYLYTVEAYADFYRRLSPGGILVFMRALGHQEPIESDTLRGIAVTTEALARQGVAQPGAHVLVAAARSPYFDDRPMCAVLVKRDPFTTAEVETARAFLAANHFQALWLPDGTVGPESMPPPYPRFAALIRAILTTPDRPALYRQASMDIEPTTDDNPFYFVQRGGPNRPAGVGIRELGAHVAILVVLVLPFLGIPVAPLIRRTGRLGRAELAALVYFGLLGAGFMLVEIELFHVFALLLGSPAITLATVLGSLLVWSGLGSLAAGRLVGGRVARPVGVLLALVALLIAFSLGKARLMAALVGWPFEARVLATVLVIAPIALGMGMPLPIAARWLAGREDVLLWGWALNGALSVLASAGAIFLAMHAGIGATFLLGTACYLAAGALLPVLRHAGEPPRAAAGRRP